ncbi:hypothetical protein N7457_002364 [Penicillium paradoxum]|uniref:uncharacterized protein n=1 Tax=Penicillium paradoxum TaxID=176176 RepID=UPI00254921F7|nr:uncharacterized protein N7457_002364 [Penicillium paradoxum]KAJ5787374.1 hypothetical protein N7457_002364 [Penicillium paradoxum]
MSYSNTHPSLAAGSVTGSATETMVHNVDSDQRRDSTDSMTHHLYFEDDGFFPPSWIGKDIQQMLPEGSGSHESKHTSNTSAHEYEKT